MSTSTAGAPKTEIVVIGAGNVAWTLVPAFDRLEDVEVTAVYSRHLERAEEIAQMTAGSKACDNFEELPRDADIYLIAVADTAVAELASRMPKTNDHAITAHTSGSVDMTALDGTSPHTGVFYPMQTFSRGVDVDTATVPFFIEASDAPTEAVLTELAQRLSPNVRKADSATRSLLHVAAVFACNFTNHMWTISEEILGREGIPLSVMEPLVKETMRKAFGTSPEAGQTGPARRRDMTTINKHAEIAGGKLGELYMTISQHILDRYK